MKHLKFLLVSLFMMLGLAAQAQQVVINKTDGTVDVFQPNEVDSVVYKPAPKYYYYAGWECPTNEEELANFVANADGKTIIGGTINTLTGWSNSNLVLSSTHDTSKHITQTNWYICIPDGLNIYVDVFGQLQNANDTYDVITTFKVNNINYTSYKSKEVSRYLNDIIIY